MKKNGFTLLETLIALVILVGGLALLVTSWSGSYMRLRKTQTTFEIALLLEQKIGELEFEYRQLPLESIPEEKEGDFGEEYPEYKWQMSAKKLEFPDLTGLTGSDSSNADPMNTMIMKQITNTLNRAVKEVSVTVTFNPKNGAKPIKHTVTTYFVNYDTPLNLGGG